MEYLPAYSPDLNPIEKKWAQKKSIRRNNQCAIDELFKEVQEYIGLTIPLAGVMSEVFTFVDASHLIAKATLWKERDKAIKKKYDALNQ